MQNQILCFWTFSVICVQWDFVQNTQFFKRRLDRRHLKSKIDYYKIRHILNNICVKMLSKKASHVIDQHDVNCVRTRLSVSSPGPSPLHPLIRSRSSIGRVQFKQHYNIVFEHLTMLPFPIENYCPTTFKFRMILLGNQKYCIRDR